MNAMTNKTVALALGVSMLSMGIGGATTMAFNQSEEQQPALVTAGDTSDDLIRYMDDTGSAPDTDEAFKEETVYVISGKDGTVQKVIVSDWIRNTAGKTGIKDVTGLTDIEVLKDGESFTLGGDNTRVWDTTTDDVYYQGSISKEIPVDMKVSYYLDGSPISPDELPGKSGRVTIRFDYTNNTYVMKDIDGKQEKIYVPFTMLTGVLLDNEKFSNISVSNGKIVNDGSRTAVVGFAFPGLKEDLGITTDKFDIPEYVEFSADCKDFGMGMSMTIASTDLISKLDPDKITSEDDMDIDEALDKLTDAMKELTDGSSKLYDGLCTLLTKSKDLVSGVDKLAEGAKKLNDGAGALDDGADKLSKGTTQLYTGLSTLDSHSSDLNDGAKKVFESLLATAQDQLTASGLKVPKMTIGNYDDVLNKIISSLDEKKVYKKALEAVTAAVEEKRDYIASQVTAAVKKEVTSQVTEAVQAEVTKKVTSAVQSQVKSAVEESVREAVAEKVIYKATGLDKATYDAAVAAGKISDDTVKAIGKAIGEQMASDEVKATVKEKTDEQMESSSIQKKISAEVEKQMGSSDVKALIDSKIDETMKSSDIKSTIKKNTDAQVKKAINDTMASDEIQKQISAASEGAKKVIKLKTDLDSYGEFYSGLKDYTAAVGKATTGAKTLSSGASELKKGTKKVSDGMDTLYNGILTMKKDLPKLVDGVKKLRDGSMQLSDGLKEFDKEGISKITDLLGGDLGTVLSRIRVVTEVSKEYTNFAGIADDMDGSVKFIYKTEEFEE